MKKQMLTLVIGILIGAIIATGIFLLLETNDSSDSSNNDGSSMEMPSGERGDFDENMVGGGERPDDMGDIDSNSTNSAE